jgi:sec-independent protein translocase protein TatA
VGTFGLSELIVILMILLLVFGASRLPALGESLGRTIRGFKRGIAADEQIAVRKEPAEESGASAPPAPRKADVSDAEVVEPTKKS